MSRIEVENSFRTREKQNNDLKGMQFVALEILKEFDRICRKNNIDYWLDGGTLLGAVRHKGFIPWDDDIDVCIRKKDEERLKECLEKELPYCYFLKKYQGVDDFYKVADRYSQMKDDENHNLGVWIDIFPMSYVKNDDKINEIIKKSPKKRNIPSRKKWLNFREKIVWSILGLFNIRNREKNIEKYYKIISQKEQNSYIYMNGRAWWHIYREEWIFPLIELEFEGVKFLCPNNYDKYLRSFYGDYMELPPKKKRVPRHSIEIDIFSEIEDEEHLNWNQREEHIKSFFKEVE